MASLRRTEGRSKGCRSHPWLPLAALLPLAPLLAACGGGEEEAAASEPPERAPDLPIVIDAGAPIVLGVSATITGPDSPTGLEDRDAVIVAVQRWMQANGEQIGGHDIEIAVEDDGCTEADIAAAAAQRLADRPGVVAVVGPNCSAGAAAAIPVYADAGITVVSGSATRSDLTTSQPSEGFFFRTAFRNDLEGALMGMFASGTLIASEGYLVDDAEPYGQDLADSAQAVMEASGVRVTRLSVARGTEDFRDLVRSIVAEDPPFVGFMGYDREAALLYHQLRDAGYEGVFGAGDAAATPEFVAAGGRTDGVLFAACQLAVPADLRADFAELHGYEARSSPFTAQMVDAATVLLNAVADVAEPHADGSLVIAPRSLREAVRAGGLRDGVSGSFAFDDNGDRVPIGVERASEVVDSVLATHDMAVFLDLGLVSCQVQDGRLVHLSGPGAQPME